MVAVFRLEKMEFKARLGYIVRSCMERGKEGKGKEGNRREEKRRAEEERRGEKRRVGKGGAGERGREARGGESYLVLVASAECLQQMPALCKSKSNALAGCDRVWSVQTRSMGIKCPVVLHTQQFI